MLKRSAPIAKGASTLKRSAWAAGGVPLARKEMARGTTTLKRTEMDRGTSQLRATTSLQRTQMDRGTTELRTSTPMRRSSMGLTQLAPGKMAALAALAGAAVRTWARPKRSRPKMTPIRKSARGEACTLRIPGVCRQDASTTVWCHSNRLADGKGMGIKANDEAGCYGCSSCHAFLDGGWAAFAHWSYDLIQQYFERARAISRVILKRKGLLAA